MSGETTQKTDFMNAMIRFIYTQMENISSMVQKFKSQRRHLQQDLIHLVEQQNKRRHGLMIVF